MTRTKHSSIVTRINSTTDLITEFHTEEKAYLIQRLIMHDSTGNGTVEFELWNGFYPSKLREIADEIESHMAKNGLVF